jgi:large subunit ribosomal protein L19
VNKLVEVEKGNVRTDLTSFAPGDTVKVFFHVHEGSKDKVQAFQGVCIQVRGSGPNRSFTLRKTSQGIGIERIFPLHSPVIEKIEVVRYGKVRRAKLYYLRDKVGKGQYVKERIVRKSKDEVKSSRRRKRKKAGAKTAPAAQEQAVTAAVETEAAETEASSQTANEVAAVPVEEEKPETVQAEQTEQSEAVQAEAEASKAQAVPASEEKPAAQEVPSKESKDDNKSGPQGVEEG